ncbi:hypothetical protein CHARACLAT_014156 [Characodon lateralis]|uniref:Uncharacterized protein n=1 Tax=Characodon lateralis TaxID=208331 RepID=A0ABU7EWE8_9TELE|nr:hypothetical protein [Characodon lateralis]
MHIYPIYIGVPQGSVLEPLSYILLVFGSADFLSHLDPWKKSTSSGQHRKYSRTQPAHFNPFIFRKEIQPDNKLFSPCITKVRAVSSLSTQSEACSQCSGLHQGCHMLVVFMVRI